MENFLLLLTRSGKKIQISVLIFLLVFSVACSGKKNKDQYIIQNDFIKVTSKSLGAELFSIINKSNSIEYLWQGDTEYWADHAIIQFPFIGNAKNDSYQHENKEYEIMSHGFARLSNFHLVSKGETSVEFLLESNKETLGMFPFQFNLFVKYTLVANKIKVQFTVVNKGTSEMYFSLGYHPGFNCPIEKHLSMDDYYLEFDSPETLVSETLENNMLSGEKRVLTANSNFLNLSKSLFAKDALIFEGLNSSSVALKSKLSNRSVTVDYGDVSFMGIWSPANGGSFICIEPWHGIPGVKEVDYELKNKPGINILQGSEKFNWECEITIN